MSFRDADTEKTLDEILDRRHIKSFGLTDGGDMRRIKLIFREPAQHAGLPDPRVSEHEQPE